MCHCCYTHTHLGSLKVSLRFLRKNIKRKSKILKRPNFDFSKLWSNSSKFESSDRDQSFSRKGNMNSAFFKFFFILLIFLWFWLPYCFINYSIFQIVNSSFPSVLQFQTDLTSKNTDLSACKPFRYLVLRYHACNMTLSSWRHFVTHKKTL